MGRDRSPRPERARELFVSSLNELRTVSVVLGAAAVVASAMQSPGWLPIVLMPWALALGLLASRRGPAIQFALHALVSVLAGRLAVVALTVLALFTAVLTNAALALVVSTWVAALAVLAAATLSPSRFRDGFLNVTLMVATFAVLCAGLEAVFHLPSLARRFGTPQERARWERDYDHVERRNVFRLRSPHQTIARTPGVRRILGLGDSFTWGDKVRSTDSLWPTLLERELSHDSLPVATEVINLSQVGWNTVEEAAALNQLGWQFSPDRVVLQFCANDAEIAPGGTGEFTVRRRGEGAPRPMNLLQRSALLWVLEHSLTVSAGGVGDFHRFTPDPLESFRDDAPGWVRMRRALAEIADSARAREVPVTLVLFPDFVPGRWAPQTYPLAPVYRKVAEEARAAGYDVLDLVPVYAAEGGDWKRWWATEYDGHPSAAAQAVAARAIARHLTELGWPESTGRSTPR